jgi:high-affinity Fe2+/Pb2+ permease
MKSFIRSLKFALLITIVALTVAILFSWVQGGNVFAPMLRWPVFVICFVSAYVSLEVARWFERRDSTRSGGQGRK